MKKELKRKELFIKDVGIDAISFVEYPAIEEDFMAFNKAINITLAKVDNDKRIITGPALIPNKDIYRYDELTNEEYYIWFSEQTVEEVSQRYILEDKTSSVNLEHLVPVDNVSLIESWLVKDPENDKANSLGYKVPKGTWMTSFKVNNDDVWAKIKSGDIRGYSIEGFFVEKMSKLSSNLDNELLEMINNINDESILNEIINFIEDETK